MIFGGLRIIEDQYLGRIVTPSPPEKMFRYRGPYKQRRIRRWRVCAANHPPGEWIEEVYQWA
jgi:hypothetical protein